MGHRKDLLEGGRGGRVIEIKGLIASEDAHGDEVEAGERALPEPRMTRFVRAVPRQSGD
ncbi:hypothetical protein D3C83_160050 [compost metagenome]